MRRLSPLSHLRRLFRFLLKDSRRARCDSRTVGEKFGYTRFADSPPGRHHSPVSSANRASREQPSIFRSPLRTRVVAAAKSRQVKRSRQALCCVDSPKIGLRRGSVVGRASAAAGGRHPQEEQRPCCAEAVESVELLVLWEPSRDASVVALRRTRHGDQAMCSLCPRLSRRKPLKAGSRRGIPLDSVLLAKKLEYFESNDSWQAPDSDQEFHSFTVLSPRVSRLCRKQRIGDIVTFNINR
ncbi:hypothetical protein MRX96_005594 [Rhipicephalus microplus]